MDLPVKKIKLPSGIEVIMLEYITAGIVIDSKATKDETEGQKFLIENVVKSINGKTEKLYEEARNLRFSDYQKIDSELRKMIMGESEEVKKN